MMQLIRETKHLQRMGIAVPESARQVLAQEEKFKIYFNQLTYALKASPCSPHLACSICTLAMRTVRSWPLGSDLLWAAKIHEMLKELINLSDCRSMSGY